MQNGEVNWNLGVKVSVESTNRFRGRISRFQAGLADHGADAAILTYSRDVFYYTGVALPCVLLITPVDFVLFVKRGWEFLPNYLDVLDEHVVQGDEKRAVETLKEWGVFSGDIGLELDVIDAQTYLSWKKWLRGFELVDISPLILKQRQVKDEIEIDSIKRACKIADYGHRKAGEILREGITETELAIEIESALRQAGDEGTVFLRPPSLFLSRVVMGSGPNLNDWTGVVFSITGSGASPALPIGPSSRKIKKGELVVIDLGPCFRGYHADESRTYLVGKGNSEIRGLSSALKDISNVIISTLKPGAECKMAYAKALECSKKHNLGNSFLQLGVRDRTRLVGHGIGLELNEPPTLSPIDASVIHEGCVLSIEVHIAHPTGVLKMEDNVLVTSHEPEILSLGPRSLIEV